MEDQSAKGTNTGIDRNSSKHFTPTGTCIYAQKTRKDNPSRKMITSQQWYGG
jgi:hypothetical protein